MSQRRIMSGVVESGPQAMTNPHPTSGRRVHAAPPDDSMPADTDPPDDGVAQRLREARRAKGLTQEQVSKTLGVSRRAVSEWETGVRLPHTSIPALAALYDVTTTFLLYGVEPASAELQAMRVYISGVRDDVQDLRAALQGLSGDVKMLLVLVADLTESTTQSFASVGDLLATALDLPAEPDSDVDDRDS